MHRRALRVYVTAVLLALLLPTVAFGQTVISYLGRGGQPEREMYYEVITNFEAANPDIRIELDWIGGNADALFERLLIRVAAGIPPDVFWIHSYHTVDMAEMDLLLDLDPLLDGSDGLERDDLFPAALADFTYLGSVYALPRETSSIVMYYNQDVFEMHGVEYPDMSWTWETLLHAARKMARQEGDTIRYAMQAPMTGGKALAVVWQNEGRIMNEERSRSTMSSPAVVEALEWITALMHDHQVAPRPGQPGASFADFGAGRLALFYDIRGRVASLDPEGRWDVAHLPAGKSRATRIASSGHAIYKHTEKAEAAWRFLEYLTSEEAQEVFARGGLSIPALRSVALSEAFVDPDRPPASDWVFLESLSYARPEPVTRGYFDVVRLRDGALPAIFSGSVPAIQVLSELDRQINALLSEE